jgi:hypothetical protein
MVITHTDHIINKTKYVGFNQRFSYLRDRALTGLERDALMSVDSLIQRALTFPSLDDLDQYGKDIPEDKRQPFEYLSDCATCVMALCIELDLHGEVDQDQESVSISLGIYISELHRHLQQLEGGLDFSMATYRRTRGLHLARSFFCTDGSIDLRKYCDLRLSVFLLPLDILTAYSLAGPQLELQLIEQCMVMLVRASAYAASGDRATARQHIRKGARLAANISAPAFHGWASTQIKSLQQNLDV